MTVVSVYVKGNGCHTFYGIKEGHGGRAAAHAR